jgi:hypothetical protein
MGRQSQPGLSSAESEESRRTDDEYGLPAKDRQTAANAGELRRPDESSLQERGMEFTGHIPEEGSVRDHARIASGHPRLCLAGIELERGLELRPIDSIRRIDERITVYNLTCDPVEAYEANGFVVHNCWYAEGSAGSHRKKILLQDRLFHLLDEAAMLGMKAITWTGGGDPSLHPKIGAAVEQTHFLQMAQGMFTNALGHVNYDPSLLNWIRITMTDKPYKIEHIKRLRACPTLGFAFNYKGPQDDAYLRETLEVADQVQADYVQVRPALLHQGKTVDIKPPTHIQHPLLFITDYKFEEAKKPHGYTRCEGYHFLPFVWENGEVTVCAYMREYEGYFLGNLYKNSLKNILDHAPPFVNVTKPCQICCKLNETNIAIHRARALVDVEFP